MLEFKSQKTAKGQVFMAVTPDRLNNYIGAHSQVLYAEEHSLHSDFCLAVYSS